MKKNYDNLRQYNEKLNAELQDMRRKEMEVKKRWKMIWNLWNNYLSYFEAGKDSGELCE